jgi:asparagine synthase (glutamine-hydrolysing)
MCGIAGIFHFDGTRPDLDLLQRMTTVLAHRGPDGEGVHIGDHIGLGHRRLAIIDLSDAGKQPMSNEDGSIWITYNGEIYNFQDARKELEDRGHCFHSATDSEVVIHAYEEWGTDCLQRFNGMFAFGLWDQPRQRLWLVRDRLGIKPLFYCLRPGKIVFGSEIKAILEDPSVPRDINGEALAYYLALNYTPAPHTLFSTIRQLLPGQYLMIGTEGHEHVTPYWDVVYQEEAYRPDAWYVERFQELFNNAVKLRLVCDVPFGAFLSGGIDSSTVSYFMARNLATPLKTFSIGFGEKTYDELNYARQVARGIQSEHHEQIVKADEAEMLPKLVWHSEEPLADSSMVAVYYLAQMTRKHVTMACGGDGADEIFAGYETYQAYYLHRGYRQLPDWFRRTIIEPWVRRRPVSDAKISWDFKLRRFVKAGDLVSEDAHATWRMIFNAEARRELLAPIWDRPGVRSDAIDLYRQLFTRTNARHPLNRLLYVDTRFFLPNDMLVKVDRMTMAHGLEARVPFLDYRLVEFAATVPPHLKLRFLWLKKYLVKRAMRGKLPASVLWRKKAGFNVPHTRWMKGRLKPFVMDHLSPGRLRQFGLLNEQMVTRLLNDHFYEVADNSFEIWCLLTLMLWWELFLEKKGA